jgi:hypothetical protein
MNYIVFEHVGLVINLDASYNPTFELNLQQLYNVDMFNCPTIMVV